ncbi:MAG: homoaconitate hydratase, partial [Candidatus Cloacimonetes bacterium]|nr:homoaconitate hydratase [Candidatus Cloacimonadota bacterium]
IDARAARDFGGANVIKNMEDNQLMLDNPSLTLLTFDCNPTGSDQKYAVNQHICRKYARDNAIKVYDINAGIGTHILIQDGLAYPGSTCVTTDSHANILGAVGAFGQGMGDKDIAAAWANGKVWFKTPASVRLDFIGKRPGNVTAKDIVLNLLAKFGANSLLGYSVELYGEAIDALTLNERITLASMGTEMGAIILLIPPNREVLDYCSKRRGKAIEPVVADVDAHYKETFTIDISEFTPRVSRPGKPHDTVSVSELPQTRIDPAFIGSCTNGRYEDMKAAADILKGRKIAPGVVLKIVPATDEVWQECLDTGLVAIFKKAGALLSNAGCAGCAAGQVGQNGPGEITVSTGNRNFPGKQGKGEVYLASPAIVAASAVAGFITTPDNIPAEPVVYKPQTKPFNIDNKRDVSSYEVEEKPVKLEGRAWVIKEDNIDTDMIFHNRYLTITELAEMGQYTFDNLEGYKDFAKKAKPGDIVIVGKNFGSGSSRQQAVDCFKSLGVQAIIAESYGAIYERNAINAAFPILTCKDIDALKASDGDIVSIDLETGEVANKGINVKAEPFSEVQMSIYQKGGIF